EEGEVGGAGEEEGGHAGDGGDDADEEADGVQAVDDVRQPDQGLPRLGDDGHRTVSPRALRNARSKPGSARTTVSRSTGREMRMWPGMPTPGPGTVSTPS